MIKANLILIRNIVIVLLSVACVNGADVVTLAIEHHINDLLVEEGQYFDGELYVWPPNSDIDEPEVYSFEGETEITLELEEAGIYFFTASSVLFNADGSMAESSEQSESVDYEVIASTDIDPSEPDPNQEPGNDEDPGVSADDPGDPDNSEGNSEDPDRGRGSAAVVVAGVGGSPCGCFISSLLIWRNSE